MTYEEAIEILQEERDYAQFSKYVKDAIKIAISALEKQIPKKVIFGHDEQDAICCPNCETEIAMMDEYRYESVFYKHCPNCGQKLDWSDTE